MTLLAQVDHLRGLAEAEGRGTTLVQMATLNVLEALAVAVDQLIADRDH